MWCFHSCPSIRSFVNQYYLSPPVNLLDVFRTVVYSVSEGVPMFNSFDTFHPRYCNECCPDSTNADSAISTDRPSLALCACLLPSALQPCSSLGGTGGFPLPSFPPSLSACIGRIKSWFESRYEWGWYYGWLLVWLPLSMRCWGYTVSVGLGSCQTNVDERWIRRGSSYV